MKFNSILIGLGIVISISCNTNKPKSKFVHDPTIEAISSCLAHLYNGQDCLFSRDNSSTVIYPLVYFDRYSVVYRYINVAYEDLYIDPDASSGLFPNKNIPKALDFKKIKKIARDTLDIRQFGMKYIQGIKVLTDDKLFKLTPKEMDMSPERLHFSPLIPQKDDTLFDMWMEIDKSQDPPYYHFRLKKHGDLFEVLSCYADNFLIFGPSRDYFNDF